MSKNLKTDFTLVNCLLGAAKLNKNAELDKYGYSVYSIGFDSRSFVLLPNNEWGKDVVIFGVDNNLSTPIDNRKNILVLGGGPSGGLD